jgi:hypothetical protein
MLATVVGAKNPHGLAIEFEFDFGAGKQTRLLADFRGNGHLAL